MLSLHRPPWRRRPHLTVLVLLSAALLLLWLLWSYEVLSPSSRPPLFGSSSAPSFLPSSTVLRPSIPLLNPQPLIALGPRIWNQLRQLDCPRLVTGDPTLVARAKRQRVVLSVDPAKLDMSCKAIHSRWIFWTQQNGNQSAKKQHDELSEKDAQFPLAFARVIFRDYFLLEQMLATEYAPQNIYCYSVDAKAEEKFKQRIRSLASCFPNVIVAKREWAVFSNGKNVSRAHLDCLHELLARGGQWKYALLLQNHDIPLRTNAELVSILKVYNGTNDIATRPIMPISVNRSLDWSLRSLHLYRTASQVPSSLGLDYRLRHTKSLNLIALSRKAVQFSLVQLDLRSFVDRLERSRYGMDEVLFSTLNSNLPDFPGGFTTDCLFRHNQSVQSMGRYTIWRTYGTVTGQCQSNHFRHDVCVYGIEDLAHISRARLHFYLNKMMPSFDYGAPFCWLLHLALLGHSKQPNVNQRYYEHLNHIRYNRLRNEGRLREFKC